MEKIEERKTFCKVNYDFFNEFKFFVALPKVGPRIEGGAEHYSPGDKLNVTCISGLSHPPVNLTWYINGHLVCNQIHHHFKTEK